MNMDPGLKVLVVDDEQDLAEMLKVRLESDGFLVDVAFDADAALRKAKFWQPDAVVLDVILAGMDGWEVAQRLRKDPVTAKTVIVLVTAWPIEEAEKRAKSVGANGIVFKPFYHQELINVLRAEIGKRKY